MVRWVVGSILNGGSTDLFLGPQGRGMCYPVCGIVHIKEPLLLSEKSNPCGGNGFPLSLSEWSLTIYLTPYNCSGSFNGNDVRRVVTIPIIIKINNMKLYFATVFLFLFSA